MNKVVLILDKMPNNCTECSLHEMSYSFDEYLCVPMQKRCYKFANKKPDWCPLKELPEKHKELKREEYEFGNIGLAFTHGWNACLKNILE